MLTRLRTYIKHLQLTERSFALKCGIPQNTLNNYINGLRKPSYDFVEKVFLANPDLSSEWLIRGTGEMLLSQMDNTDKQAERLNKLIDTITTLQDTINAKSEQIALLTERIKQLENQH